MADRLADELTQATRADIFSALWRAWVNAFEMLPARDSILLLVAHWALETGWGESMHCYNLGNIKSRDGDGRDYCYFECGEEITLHEAAKWVANAPTLVTIKYAYKSKTNVPMASVHVKPDHFAARFRAYRTLEEGAVDYLALIRLKYSGAWPFVGVGDPVGFVHALKRIGYFTASEERYTKDVQSIFSNLKSTLHVDTDALPVLSDEHVRRLMNLVSLTSQDMVNEALQESQAARRKEDE